jgi:nucleoside-diphosphate-sugar epimerase
MPTEKYIMVTGASGLVGTELIHQLLHQGKKVKAIVNVTPLSITHENLLIEPCDLLDVMALEEVMTDVSTVYHCAGFVNFSPRNRERLFKINTEATANIVNTCLSVGIQKLVHVSSIAALGRVSNGAVVNEKMEWNPDTNNSVYGQSKYLGELEVWRGIAEGLDAVIVNPGVILGAGNWDEGSTAMFKKVHEGFNWYSEGVNGFVDVRDLCKAMIGLMDSSITAEKFIIIGGNYSYKEVFFAMADAFKIKRPSKKITPSLAAIAWRIEKIKSWITHKEPLVTRETAQSALSIYKLDNTKLFSFLPDFTYHSLKECIEFSCERLQQKVNKV